MKLNNILLGLFVAWAISVFSSDICAQRRIITGKEYFEGADKQTLKVFERSRRVENTIETISAGVITKTVTNISEYLLPSRKHFYTKITEGEKVSEIEQINIDYIQYDRKNGGVWTKFDTRQSGSGLGNGSGSGSSRRCDQYGVESAYLDGKPMQLFDWLIIDASGNELTFVEMKTWIGEDGFPYRVEDTRGKLSPREEKSRRIVKYEYDPNIKIEAPIK